MPAFKRISFYLGHSVWLRSQVVIEPAHKILVLLQTAKTQMSLLKP